MFTPKVRERIYIAAFVLAVIVGGLVLFGKVGTEEVTIALGVVALVFAGVSGLAYRNVDRGEEDQEP